MDCRQVNLRQSNQKRSRKGFSLSEVLIALLILLLVTSIVAAGIPVAANAMKRSVTASNAQLLLSTTLTRLRDEFGNAKNITETDVQTGAISYTNEDGVPCVISPETGANGLGIRLTRYAGMDIAYSMMLVSDKAANEDLYVTYELPSTDAYKDGVLTLKNVKVFQKKADGSAAEDSAYADAFLETVRIRVSVG